MTNKIENFKSQCQIKSKIPISNWKLKIGHLFGIVILALIIFSILLTACGKNSETIKQTEQLRIPESKGPSGPPAIGAPTTPVPH